MPGRPVLEDIDLAVPAGRTVALIGHTGSGKTTLTSLVPRFYDATSGRVLVDGVDVRDVTLRSLRREIGVISQDPFLFSATVRENITSGAPGLLIAHRLSPISLADEIVVLDSGRIVARGMHDELLELSQVYRDIYEHGLLERQFADAVEARAAVEEVA